jgi:hypothetical protein
MGTEKKINLGNLNLNKTNTHSPNINPIPSLNNNNLNLKEIRNSYTKNKFKLSNRSLSLSVLESDLSNISTKETELNKILFNNLQQDSNFNSGIEKKEEEFNKLKKPFKILIDKNENFLKELSVLDEIINKNKSEYEENKKNIFKLKEEFLKLNKELKEGFFSEYKVLLDMIELEINQNNFNNESFEKIKKIIKKIK